MSFKQDNYFVLREEEFLHEDKALYSHHNNLNLPIDYYYFDFFKTLLIDSGPIEYLDFLRFQIDNSVNEQGLVNVIREEFLEIIKYVNDTSVNIEIGTVMTEIMTNTNSKKLFKVYGSETLFDPELINSRYYFSKFIKCNKDKVKLRISEIDKFLDINYNVDYLKSINDRSNFVIKDNAFPFVFTDYGYNLFLYIIFKFEKKINISFYSYLYHYFNIVSENEVKSRLFVSNKPGRYIKFIKDNYNSNFTQLLPGTQLKQKELNITFKYIEKSLINLIQMNKIVK